MLVERPKSFIPVEDQGYLIVTVQTPDGTTQEPTSRVMDRVEQIALKMDGVADTIRFDGLNPLTQVNQSNSGAVYVVLKHWEEREEPELRARALVAQLQKKLSAEITEALALVFPPPPIQGLGTTGGFEFLIEDREGRGVQAAGRRRRPLHGRGRASGPSCPDSSLPSRCAFPSSASSSTGARPATSTCRSPRSSRPSRSTWAATTSTTSTGSARPGGSTSSPRAIAGGMPDDILAIQGAEQPRRARSLSALGDVKSIVGPIDVPHYNLYNAAKITGNPAPGYSSGQADPRHAGDRRRRASCPRASTTNGPARPIRS